MNLSRWAEGLLVAAAIQIPLHFLVYAAFLRHSAWLRTERGIFAYHFFSACIITVIVFAATALSRTPESFAIMIAAIAAHGVYSLTFLEFWSLSQISYSREILLSARAGAISDDDSPPQSLVDLGDQKRGTRLESLEPLGLLSRSNGHWTLTGRGRMASAALRMLQWLPNSRNAG